MGYWSVVTPPAAEPFTTAEAKTQCRVDIADDDTYIDTLVKAARICAESVTHQQMITTVYDYYLDDFPGTTGTITLPTTPATVISSIKYQDTANDEQTLDSSVYQTDIVTPFSRIATVQSQTWPQVYSEAINAVVIRYSAGFGATSAAIPQALRQGMLLLIAHWYANRESVSEGTMSRVPYGVEYLFSQFKVRKP